MWGLQWGIFGSCRVRLRYTAEFLLFLVPKTQWSPIDPYGHITCTCKYLQEHGTHCRSRLSKAPVANLQSGY